MYKLKLCKKTSFLNIQDMVLNITYSACQILAFWPNLSEPNQPFARWIIDDNMILFVWFDSLHPSQQFFSYMYVWPGLPGVEPVLNRGFVLLKDTMQCLPWGSNLQPIDLESSTLPLSHHPPHDTGIMIICLQYM